MAERTQRGRRSGRRPGTTQTRADIALAARQLFAAHGFDRTTIRGVAAEAGVDPALVMHFFGSKRQLFATVMDLPVDIGRALPAVLAGEPGGMGRRLADFVLSVIDGDESGDRLEAMVRAATSEPKATEILRDQIASHLMKPLSETLEFPDARLRANLIGSTAAGMVMARRILRLEPLASTSRDEVASLLAPVFQHYLTGQVG